MATLSPMSPMKSSPMKSKKAIPFMKKVMKAMKKAMRPKKVMQAKPPKKVMQAKPMKRPAAAKRPADCLASSKCYRRDCRYNPWRGRSKVLSGAIFVAQ